MARLAIKTARTTVNTGNAAVNHGEGLAAEIFRQQLTMAVQQADRHDTVSYQSKDDHPDKEEGQDKAAAQAAAQLMAFMQDSSPRRVRATETTGGDNTPQNKLVPKSPEKAGQTTNTAKPVTEKKPEPGANTHIKTEKVKPEIPVVTSDPEKPLISGKTILVKEESPAAVHEKAKKAADLPTITGEEPNPAEGEESASKEKTPELLADDSGNDGIKLDPSVFTPVANPEKTRETLELRPSENHAQNGDSQNKNTVQPQTGGQTDAKNQGGHGDQRGQRQSLAAAEIKTSGKSAATAKNTSETTVFSANTYTGNPAPAAKIITSGKIFQAAQLEEHLLDLARQTEAGNQAKALVDSDVYGTLELEVHRTATEVLVKIVARDSQTMERLQQDLQTVQDNLARQMQQQISWEWGHRQQDQAETEQPAKSRPRKKTEENVINPLPNLQRRINNLSTIELLA